MSTGGRRGLLDFGPGNDFVSSWEPDTRVNCGAGLLDTGPSRNEHHAGYFSGCEKAFAHPLTPQPYVASSNHLRSYWCGGLRTDKNYCRTVDLYD
jgi:hypothetical protein